MNLRGREATQLVAPAVLAHHEQPHRRRFVEPVPLPLQMPSEELQRHFGEVHCVGGSELRKAVVWKRAIRAPVRPWPHQQPLSPTRRLGRAFRAHPREVLERPGEEQVVPRADVAGRHLDLGIVTVDGDALP